MVADVYHAHISAGPLVGHTAVEDGLTSIKYQVYQVYKVQVLSISTSIKYQVSSVKFQVSGV